MFRIAELKRFLDENNSGRDCTRAKVISFGAVLISYAIILFREAAGGDLKYRAMSLVYTTLLSLAPLLAVSFSVLKGFGYHNALKEPLLTALKPLGEQGVAMAGQIIGYVEKINFGVLGATGLVFLLYTVVSLLGIIEECFNRIWRVEKSSNWIRRSSDYLSMLLLGPVLVVSALGLMASMANTRLVQTLVAKEPFGSAYYLAGLILPYILIVAALTFLYIFMPNTRVNFRSAFIGGIAAGLSWKVVGWLFAEFVAKSASYNAIYSSFAIILIFMIWVYYSWLIVLLGGVVSFLHQYPYYLRHNNQKPRLNHRQQETLGLFLMYLIGKSYFTGKHPCTLHGLAGEAELPWEAVQYLLDDLESCGFVIAVDSEPRGYVPARALETITLTEIYNCLHNFGIQPQRVEIESDRAESVRSLAEQIEKAAHAPLASLTLRDLVCRSQ